MKRWVLCPRIGDGLSRATAFRPKIAGLADHQSLCFPNRDWVVCLISASNMTAIDADPEVISLPDLDTQLSALTGGARNRIQNFLTGKGVDMTGITLSSTIRDVLRRAGQFMQSGFDETKVDLADRT